MPAALSPHAHQLADYMSELSEEAYCAGWMQDLEHALWDALLHGPRPYGQLELTADHLDRLRALSAAAGGWIAFDDDDCVFVAMTAWPARFAAWQAQQPTEG